MKSLPSRECGLKWSVSREEGQRQSVTPLAGVWIEIAIELGIMGEVDASLPSRECGLKSQSHSQSPSSPCHSPRGSVD